MSTQAIVGTELETWQNLGQGRVVIKRIEARTGDLTKEEMVGPGKSFTITTREREANSALAYNEKLDFFRNGTLTPIHLVEGSDAARELANNPNLISDGDMRTMVGASKSRAKVEAFAERLRAIENPTTLSRMLQLAEEEDAPVSKVRAIQARLAEVEGIGFSPVPERPVDGPAAGGPGRDSGAMSRAVTPR